MRRLKILMVVILGIQVITYLLFAAIALEEHVNRKYLDLTEERLNNPYNRKLNQSIEVASCGDEFFRDLTSIRKTISRTDPLIDINDDWNSRMSYLRQHVVDISYRDGYIKPDEVKDSVLYIIYRACRMRSIPFLYTRINYDYVFHYYPVHYDIHHNGQVLEKSPSYVWMIFRWFEFHIPKEFHY